MRYTLIAIALLFPISSAAADLSCVEEDRTEVHMCFNESSLSASTNGLVRESALWKGGPKKVRKTSFVVRVLCVKGGNSLIQIRNRDGVLVGHGDVKNATSRSLASYMCDAKPTRTDKALDSAKW